MRQRYTNSTVFHYHTYICMLDCIMGTNSKSFTCKFYSIIYLRLMIAHTHVHVYNILISSLSLFTEPLLQYYKTELQTQTMEFAGLSASYRQELEDLLMEGDLLEVTVEEVKQLWQLLTSNAEFQVAFEQVQTVANRAN